MIVGQVAFSGLLDTIKKDLNKEASIIRSLLVLNFVMALWAVPVSAAEIAVTENLVVVVDLSEGWTLHFDPPEALVKEMAGHVAHEAAAANATPEQIERVARKRMADNEAIVYHEESGAYLYVDFSPLDPGNTAPNSKTLRNSAKYAAQSLEGEEDVTEVSWEVTPVKVNGARETFQLAADYKQHELPMKFLGIIGYVEGFWFFLYYTDPMKDPETFGEMKSMLEQLIVRPSET